MKMTRFSDPQILAILRQAEGGVPAAELCREHGMGLRVLFSASAEREGPSVEPQTRLSHLLRAGAEPSPANG